MAEINVNLSSLVLLLEFFGFSQIFEPDNDGLPKPNDKEIYLASKKYKIKLNQIQEHSDDQYEVLAIPQLKDQTSELVAEKLTSIIALISSESSSRKNNTEICTLRRGSSVNISKSFTVNHNVVLNLETSDLCTSPPARCSSPVMARLGQTPSRPNKATVTDLLKKAINLIDLAVEMAAKVNLDPTDLGLNSTFTKDQTAEKIRLEGPRISNISKVSPLADIKYEADEKMQIDNVMPLLDVTNKSDASHMSAPKKLANALNKIVYDKKNESMEKKWKRPFTKIGILKQPSKASGITSIRNSPITRLKENRVDTPRPFGASRSCSTSNLMSSPYLRPTPRGTTTNSTNTPSPRYLRAQDSTNTKLTPSSLRKPGWYGKK